MYTKMIPEVEQIPIKDYKRVFIDGKVWNCWFRPNRQQWECRHQTKTGVDIKWITGVLELHVDKLRYD